MTKLKPLILIGPTASGKSAYAVGRAIAEKGVVINADSMQIYQELPILTAQPSSQERATAPHVLYGLRSGSDPCSVATWCALAQEEVERARSQGLRPILVGGTGLYLSSFIKGLSIIPEIDETIRADTRQLFKDLGAEQFHLELKALDPEAAERLAPNDQQRNMRAYEVIRSTGRSLLYWHAQAEKSPQRECEVVAISRPRPILHERATLRFDSMIQQGALEEVETLLKLQYADDLPIMRALGVYEIAQHLKGIWTLEEARSRAVIATRQYIKRQTTWINNQFPQAQRIEFE